MTTNLNHIIVLEDEANLRRDLTEYLASQGYSTVGAGSLAEFRQACLCREPDVVLLDINLPDGSGFDLARELRRSGQVRIVMLTSRGTLEDRLTGLDCGSDAYLVKHADLREIDATIRCVLRRTTAHAVEPAWQYDGQTWLLTPPSGVSIKLTASEAIFLGMLLERPGASVPRERIAAAMPRPRDAADRSLDSMVKRLRKKVEEAAGRSFPVNAVYSLGYSFTAPARCVLGAPGPDSAVAPPRPSFSPILYQPLHS